MKRHVLPGAALLAGAIMLLPAQAQAQLTFVGNPLCSAWSQLEGGWVQCGGNFEGNDDGVNLPNVISWIDNNWGLEVSLAGQTDGATGVFDPMSETGSSTGTLYFTEGVSGVFVLSLKAASHFSLYQFDTGGAVWTSLDYSTIGVSTNPRGIPQGLSHALYLQGATTVVPEPASMALLLSGLMGVGLVAWRRKEDAEK